MKRRLQYFRAWLSFVFVAVAQFLSPAAAADPASKIDPPAWSHRLSRGELQAYATRAIVADPQRRSGIPRETRQRLIEARPSLPRQK